MNVKKALEVVALQNGVSVSKMRAEIQKSIDTGMQSTNAITKEYWAKIPRKSKKVTPEDVIIFLVKASDI